MTVGERIKKRRKELKMSADKLGELIGKDRSTIYRYEAGEIENMPVEIISKIAKALNVSPVYLMGWDTEEKVETYSTYPYLPVSISAGVAYNVDPLMRDDIETISIPDEIMGKWANDKNIFFMRVNGDSMNNVFPHGSLIAVKPVELHTLKNGDIVVYSECGDYAVKRYYRDDVRIIFRPDSKDPSFYDHITDISNENLKIHGKVVLYIVELD